MSNYPDGFNGVLPHETEEALQMLDEVAKYQQRAERRLLLALSKQPMPYDPFAEDECGKCAECEQRTVTNGRCAECSSQTRVDNCRINTVI